MSSLNFVRIQRIIPLMTEELINIKNTRLSHKKNHGVKPNKSLSLFVHKAGFVRWSHDNPHSAPFIQKRRNWLVNGTIRFQDQCRWFRLFADASLIINCRVKIRVKNLMTSDYLVVFIIRYFMVKTFNCSNANRHESITSGGLFYIPSIIELNFFTFIWRGQHHLSQQ